ncbi:enhanced serine sensitivity protein SseB C-terminal domain-containing protein [Proteus faecis]|uniref:Enhanced serine sensitivity protein SseB C-terminal domain-containing protein n=1 Tax=Proteus faecis TaxID=2050967 RepID=A0AAW7CW34_9GAMM|nr:enhanced serine sensitivity protein SseB C-terminal domain-containing protein [Proteus faecis]MBG3012698.1 enhanced serine sensitivity protein SseB C-terminal domain-containing protein [Proteus mirabilis]MDL5168466.1 enhanced serine sensitivity protein SseB C-terminal domain-containing protein [Proteus faecis]MDL5276449.1 enhanced serine sensitivity protein SseB C-terminal domain-containing protein [Proteus faecis]MDL5280016.1 enhanced serine sensitivity protein SseB C-terminal domain-contai
MGVSEQFETQEIVSVEGSSLKLSILEPQPEKLTTALSEFFGEHKPIRRAFLVNAQEEDEEESFYLIGLEITGKEDEIAQILPQAAESAFEYLEEGQSLDFCFVNKDEKGVSHFMIHHVSPFYQRKLGGFLRKGIPIVNLDS